MVLASACGSGVANLTLDIAVVVIDGMTIFKNGVAKKGEME
jgi:hypothetical protein